MPLITLEDFALPALEKQFPQPEAVGAEVEEERLLAAEVQAVQRAAAEAAQGQWEACRQTLTAVGSRSALRHWRVFSAACAIFLPVSTGRRKPILPACPRIPPLRLALRNTSACLILLECCATTSMPYCKPPGWTPSLRERFHPQTMTALEVVRSAEYPEHIVLVFHLPGWRETATGRLLRPAQVTVARQPTDSASRAD